MKVYAPLIFLFLSFCAQAECFEVMVDVQHRKQNGKQWDVGLGDTEPEIALCIHDSLGYRCKVNSENPNQHKSICGGAFSCTFNSIYFPDQTFTIEIQDLDQKSPDQIGKVQCVRGEVCHVGVSEVTFMHAKCVSPVE